MNRLAKRAQLVHINPRAYMQSGKDRAKDKGFSLF